MIYLFCCIPLFAILGPFETPQQSSNSSAPTDSFDSWLENSLADADNVNVAKVDQTSVELSRLLYRWRIALSINDPQRRPTREELEAVAIAVVKQELAFRFLSKLGLAANDDELDRWIKSEMQRLSEVKWSPESEAKNSKLTLAAWRREQRWQISWKRYWDRQIENQALQKYFAKNSMLYDGTQLKIAQIVRLRPARDESGEAFQAELKLIDQVAADLKSGNITFANAASQYSQGSTAHQGGDIGWIRSTGPMHPSITKNAFALTDDTISPPIITPLGVHLIKVIERKPGGKQLDQVVDRVKPDLINYLIAYLAKEGEKGIELEWSSPFSDSPPNVHLAPN